MVTAATLSPIHTECLRLLGPRDSQPAVLGEDQWRAVDEIAADQRLQPHLHSRRHRGELLPDVPRAIAERWAAAYRASAIEGLAQQRDLIRLTSALSDAGIASVALKGAWLAWHAYPAAPERVLRDVDLLVAESDAAVALEILLEQGLVSREPLPDDPADFARANKQFPPLLCPSGTVIELHSHAWEPPGSMEWPTPPLRDGEMLDGARAAEIGGPSFFEPASMLAHLTIHAAYSHRFEVGPLLLSDVDYLLQTAPIDWAAFWRKATEGKYERGAALTFALVERWRLPRLLEKCRCPLDLPPDAVTHASALLLQPSAMRRDTRSFAAFEQARASGGIGAAAATGLARLTKAARNPAQLARRMGETLRALSSSEVHAQARSSACVGEWLEGNE